MKNLFKLSRIAVTVMTVLMVGAIYSCKKDEPTIVKIQVVDPDGFAVKEAKVRLYGKSSSTDTTVNKTTEIRFDETKYTDGAGQVSYDLSSLTKPGQAGFVVLDVQASKLDQIGNGIVRVEEKKTNEKQIIIQSNGGN